MPKPGTPQESPIGASAKAKATLSRIAAETGIRRLDLLDQAVDALAAHYEHHGKRLLLPLRFHETFSVVTLPIPPKPMMLHEPPSRVRSELVRPEGSDKTRKPERQRAVRG